MNYRPATFANNSSPPSWRKRLESSVLDYCARNNASPQDVVESVSDFLQGAPAVGDRLTRAELRHRVKNEMQLLISSMRHRRRAVNSEKDAGCDSCIGQVAALANLSDVLDGDASGPGVDLAVQCARITDAISKALQLDGKIRMEVEAEAIYVPAESARNVVLILNEALTNAIKHAFGDHGGTVRVKLASTSSREAELTVIDDGCGSAASGHGGLGGSMIDALAAQIDGRVYRSKTSTGFRLSCAFPLD